MAGEGSDFTQSLMLEQAQVVGHVHTLSTKVEKLTKQMKQVLSLLDKESKRSKIEVPKFDGDNYLEWMNKVERVIDVKGYSNEEVYKMVVSKLRKNASFWFENLKGRRALEGKPKIKTWSKLKRYMDKRFLPLSYKQDMYLRGASHNRNHEVVTQEETIICQPREGEPLEHYEPILVQEMNVILKEEKGTLSERIEDFKPALKESLLEHKETVIECTHGTLPSMEVSASSISYDQDAEIPILVLVDVIKGIEDQNHEGDFEEEELTLALKGNDETFIQAENDEIKSITPFMKPNILDWPLIQVESDPKETIFNHDQAPPSDLSVDEYIWVFNKLMGANNCVGRCSYELAPITFKNSYAFKRNGVLSTLEFLTLKRCNKFSRMILMDFIPKDLRANPFEEGEIDTEYKAISCPINIMISFTFSEVQKTPFSVEKRGVWRLNQAWESLKWDIWLFRVKASSIAQYSA